MTAAAATAQLVAIYAGAGMASRPRMIPREIPPDLIEADYASQLVAIVREWRAEIDPLLADLPRMLERVRRDSSTRLDDTPEGTAVRSAITRAKTVAGRTARVSAAARRAGQQAAEHQRKQFGRQMKAGFGVEIPTQDARVPTMIERFVEGNVSRIQSLEAKVFGEVERLVLDAFERGGNVDELTAEIARRFEVAEGIARRIAGDQITRLTAQVREARHLEVGITLFRWRTKNDPNVRPSHAVKHDKIFPYKGSRAPSFKPGEENGCRCQAVPVIADIKSKAAALAGKGRRRVA